MAGKASPRGRMRDLMSGRKYSAGSGQAAHGAPTGAMPVQVGRDRLTKTSKDVGKVRSGAGKLKGALTGDRLDEIASLLDEYHRATTEDERQPILRELHDLCEWYLFDHTGHKDQAHKGEQQKVGLVEDIIAEVKRELTRAEAQQIYLDDAYGNEREVRSKKHGTKMSTKFALKHQADGEQVGHSTAKMMEGRKEFSSGLQLMTRHDLTEAEVYAIRTFTADDYRYMNPATANSTSRMTGYMADKGKDEKQREGLVQEGTLHTGIAMQGLAKLPPMRGTLFRGARLTPADFAKEYTVGNTVTFPSLTSSSRSRKVAEGWASHNDGGKTVHYVATLNATNARDIKALSQVKTEEEWLLLPGATFVVKSVRKDESKGLAAGHVWYEVELQQTK